MALHNSDIPEPLFPVLQGYACLVSPRFLPDLTKLSFLDVHDFFLSYILLNPYFEVYPPSEQYQISFWKWSVGVLEGMDAEIDDRIYRHLVHLLQGTSSCVVCLTTLYMLDLTRGISDSKPPSESYATYFWKAPATADDANSSSSRRTMSATLLESRTLIESGTTGLTTWSASISLAEFLIRRPQLVRGKRVLELGCGVGFLGIVAAALQLHNTAEDCAAAQGDPALWLTDVDTSVLVRCWDNVQLPCNASSRHPSIRCTTLDWTDATSPLTCPSLVSMLREINADVIIGADIVFDPGVLSPLVNTLSLTMKTGKADFCKDVAAYVALTVRNEKTLSHFVETAERSFELLDVSRELRGDHIFARQQNNDQEVRLCKLQLHTLGRRA